MMNIQKPGKTKQELLDKLEGLKTELSKQVDDNNVKIEKINDGYNIKAEKKVLFMSFYVDANIIAKEGSYEITWESNAPDSKVIEALEKVKEALEK